MIPAFEFATATRIVFGRGAARNLPELVLPHGQRALFVTGSRPERVAWLAESLERAGLALTPFSVTHEPSTVIAGQALELAKRSQVDVVVAVGGGSVIDTAKAVAALVNQDGELFDYLEIVGKGRALARPGVPLFALPTTSGTGAEVTRNAVLGVPEQHLKVSLRSPLMLPKLALVDAELARSVPAEVTAATGLDALTQCLEPFVSKYHNPLVDGWCLEGMRRAAGSLRRACADGDDLDAREDLALTSLFGGLALANARLGAVHGFAAPIGGAFAARHGAVCARLLPEVIAGNVAALRRREPQSESLTRYQRVAEMLTGRAAATVEDAVDWLRELCGELRIPRFRDYGMSSEHFAGLAARARQASSMRGNPLELTDDELGAILEAAW